MTDSANDPDARYARLATSIFDDLRKCNGFEELGNVLFNLVGVRNEAVCEGDELTAAICSHFIDGGLAALLELRPPKEHLKSVVKRIGDFAAEGLETWCIELRQPPKLRLVQAKPGSDSP